jgi:hypothetical protein
MLSMALVWLAVSINPNPKRVLDTLLLCLYAPVFFASFLLSHMVRYLFFSVAAAVEAASGVEMRIVEQPGLLEGVIKRCQVMAEVRGCVYEPLGWVDARTLVYRKWCRGYLHGGGLAIR